MAKFKAKKENFKLTLLFGGNDCTTVVSGLNGTIQKVS